MKYNTLYEEFINGRNFISKYEFKIDNQGNPIIVVTYGSKEKIIYRDTKENREMIKKYEEKIKEQLKIYSSKKAQIKTKKSKKNNDFNSFISSTIAYVTIIANLILAGILHFNPTFITTSTSLNSIIGFTMGGITLICALTIAKPYIQEEIDRLKFEKTEKDIEKNLSFIELQSLLIQSLDKGYSLPEDISKKSKKAINKNYQKRTLSVGTIDEVSYEDMIKIETKLKEHEKHEKEFETHTKKMTVTPVRKPNKI